MREFFSVLLLAVFVIVIKGSGNTEHSISLSEFGRVLIFNGRVVEGLCCDWMSEEKLKCLAFIGIVLEDILKYFKIHLK
jgi:hypothetical protein